MAAWWWIDARFRVGAWRHILHNPVVPDLLKSDPGMVDYVSIMSKCWDC